jgi:hypothetical protein
VDVVKADSPYVSGSQEVARSAMLKAASWKVLA